MRANAPEIDLGIAAFEASDWRKALQHFDRAIALNDSDALPFQLRGATLLELRRYHDALKDFEQSILLAPFSELGYLGKARAFAGLKDYRWAVVQLTNAIDLIPEDADASDYYLERAELYTHIGERRRAEQDRQHAASLSATSR